MLPLRDNIPTSRTPYVTYALIAANVLVYFFWQRAGSRSATRATPHYICQLQDWAAIPYELTHPGDQVQIAAGCARPDDAPTYLTVFTAMFMHGGLLHLGGNMLFLWIFGNNVEDAMGPVKFLLFYVLGGVAALALQVVDRPELDGRRRSAPRARSRRVLGGYILLFPRARVVTVIFIVFFFTILELPALLVLGALVPAAGDVRRYDIGSRRGGGVAYFAHIGGFVFGLLAVRLFASRKRVDSSQTECACRADELIRRVARWRWLAAGDRRRSALGVPAQRHRATRRTVRDRRRHAPPARCRTPHGAAGRRRDRALAAGGPARPARRPGPASSSRSRRARRCCSTSTPAACSTATTRRGCCRSPR